jgi:predicted nucleic acid-binding protein
MVYALPALPSGAVVLVDANIFVYGLLRESPQCTHLIDRCRSEDVAGVTTLEIAGEVCHRLMLKEAMDAGYIRKPAASSLKGKQHAIRGLHKYWELTALIFEWNLVVLASNEVRHHSAQRIRAKYGLLTNDSLAVAACLEYEIRALASRDTDFDRIAELTVYRPTDIG